MRDEADEVQVRARVWALRCSKPCMRKVQRKEGVSTGELGDDGRGGPCMSYEEARDSGKRDCMERVNGATQRCKQRPMSRVTVKSEVLHWEGMRGEEVGNTFV